MSGSFFIYYLVPYYVIITVLKYLVRKERQISILNKRFFYHF